MIRGGTQQVKTFSTEYTAENMTKHAGLVNLEKFAEKIGRPGFLEKRLTIKRDATADYKMSEIVMMLMMGVLAGGQAYKPSSDLGSGSGHPEVVWLGAVSRCEHLWQAV
jgi:hypothetical protein